MSVVRGEYSPYVSCLHAVNGLQVSLRVSLVVLRELFKCATYSCIHIVYFVFQMFPDAFEFVPLGAYHHYTFTYYFSGSHIEVHQSYHSYSFIRFTSFAMYIPSCIFTCSK